MAGKCRVRLYADFRHNLAPDPQFDGARLAGECTTRNQFGRPMKSPFRGTIKSRPGLPPGTQRNRLAPYQLRHVRRVSWVISAARGLAPGPQLLGLNRAANRSSGQDCGPTALPGTVYPFEVYMSNDVHTVSLSNPPPLPVSLGYILRHQLGSLSGEPFVCTVCTHDGYLKAGRKFMGRFSGDFRPNLAPRPL